MTRTAERKVYRRRWMTIAYGVVAAMWTVNTILNFVWFGELGALNIVLPLLWAFLAMIYGRPYAVVRDHDFTIAVAPLRPRTLARDQIVSLEEAKPGIVKLGLADGGKLVVRVKDVRKPDQEYLRAVLGAHLSAPASEPAVASAG